MPCGGSVPPSSAVPPRPVTCPLCGRGFLPEAMGCAGCPLGGGGCTLACCPHCGHTFPTRSWLVDRLRRWVEAIRPPRDP